MYVYIYIYIHKYIGTEVKLLIMSFDTAQQLETTGEVDDDDLLELQVATYPKHTLIHYFIIYYYY